MCQFHSLGKTRCKACDKVGGVVFKKHRVSTSTLNVKSRIYKNPEIVFLL